MNQNEELGQISESLLRYIIRKKNEYSSRSRYDIFNDWCHGSNIKIHFQENVDWCLFTIERIRKTSLKNSDVLNKFFT